MNKLEQIESFGAFLDFLANPDEYKGLVNDVRAAAKEYKELVEKKRQIKDIDKWRAEEGVRLQGHYDELNRKEEAHLKHVADLAKEVASHKKSVAESNKKMQERENFLSLREDAVSGLEKEKDKLDKLKAEYESKINDMRIEKDRLKAQKEDIQRMLGGLK
jgi:chromosome segregation ATPase